MRTPPPFPGAHDVQLEKKNQHIPQYPHIHNHSTLPHHTARSMHSANPRPRGTTTKTEQMEDKKSTPRTRTWTPFGSDKVTSSIHYRPLAHTRFFSSYSKHSLDHTTYCSCSILKIRAHAPCAASPLQKWPVLTRHVSYAALVCCQP